MFIGYSSLHKGYKCLDPKDGRVYISRDVVFDEHIFPFASLHPNAGALLRKEVELLPDLFPSSATSPGNITSLHQHMLSPNPTNSSSSSIDVADSTGTSPSLNDAENRRHNAHLPGHFMCSPVGGSASPGTHSPAPDPPGTATVSSSGSAPLSLASSGDMISGMGSSAASPTPHLATPPHAEPHPDLTEVTAPPTATAVIPPSGSGTTAAPVADSAAPVPQRPSTRLSHGISKPKTRTDGTVRWCMHARVPTGEPTTLNDALGNKDWVTAMDTEYQALMNNKTWHLVPRPKGKNIVGYKWVYKIKRKADGTIDRYKARLVAKGFKQQYGIDYEACCQICNYQACSFFGCV